MKKFLLLCLDTFTHDQVFSWPMKHLGAVAEIYGGTGNVDAVIARRLAEHQPDVVVWSAVCGGQSMPSEHALRSLPARRVMICWDAGHKDWHPYLDEYKKHDTFDLVVAADGSFDWPRRKQDLPALCPINPEWYDEQAANTDRPIDLGFRGSYSDGDARAKVLEGLDGVAVVERRTGPPGAYRDYADFMLSCRATVNVAHSAGDGPMHVKARCVEAAWAGCMLFETKGSPLSRWVGDYKFHEYESPAEIVKTVQHPAFRKYAPEIAARLREAMQPHHPRHFWQQVIDG